MEENDSLTVDHARSGFQSPMARTKEVGEIHFAK